MRFVVLCERAFGGWLTNGGWLQVVEPGGAALERRRAHVAQRPRGRRRVPRAQRGSVDVVAQSQVALVAPLALRQRRGGHGAARAQEAQDQGGDRAPPPADRGERASARGAAAAGAAARVGRAGLHADVGRVGRRRRLRRHQRAPLGRPGAARRGARPLRRRWRPNGRRRGRPQHGAHRVHLPHRGLHHGPLRAAVRLFAAHRERHRLLPAGRHAAAARHADALAQTARGLGQFAHHRVGPRHAPERQVCRQQDVRQVEIRG
jgi:hypothetical protein